MTRHLPVRTSTQSPGLLQEASAYRGRLPTAPPEVPLVERRQVQVVLPVHRLLHKALRVETTVGQRQGQVLVPWLTKSPSHLQLSDGNVSHAESSAAAVNRGMAEHDAYAKMMASLPVALQSEARFDTFLKVSVHSSVHSANVNNLPTHLPACLPACVFDTHISYAAWLFS